MIRCSILILFALTPALAADDVKPARVKVDLDVTAAPDLKEWGAKAKALCEKWHPLIAAQLGVKEDVSRPIRLIFKMDKKGIASTSGAVITVSADYVRKHPDDFGMIVHELTHVVQAYPNPNPGWLTEGIADYVRYYHYEPEKRRPRFNPKSSYQNGYGAAAAFLDWIVKTHDKKLVSKLNAAMHSGKYKGELFKEWTGKELPELWQDYARAQEKK